MHKQIKIYKPDLIIWMDTIKKGRFENMNKIFKKPKNYNLKLKKKNLTINFSKVKKLINKDKQSVR